VGSGPGTGIVMVKMAAAMLAVQLTKLPLLRLMDLVVQLMVLLSALRQPLIYVLLD
jgi:hypothetical protein